METITTRWCRRLEIQTPFLNINLFRFSPVASEICYLFATRGRRLNILSSRTGLYTTRFHIPGSVYFGRGRISITNKKVARGKKKKGALPFRASISFILFYSMHGMGSKRNRGIVEKSKNWGWFSILKRYIEMSFCYLKCYSIPYI